MNASQGSTSGVRSTGQMMADRAPVYDKVFKKKPRAGRPRKNTKAQHWLK